MTGLTWFVAVAATSVVLAIGWCRRHQGRRAVDVWEFAFLAAPPLALSLICLFAGPAGDRVHLVWSGLDLPLHRGEAVSFGGSYENDSVLLDNFPDRAFVIERRHNGTIDTITLVRQDASVLVTLPDRPAAQEWGYTTLATGDQIRVPSGQSQLQTVTYLNDGLASGAQFESALGRVEFLTRTRNWLPSWFGLLSARVVPWTHITLDGRPLHLGSLIGVDDCSTTRSAVYRRRAGLGWVYRTALLDPRAETSRKNAEPTRLELGVDELARFTGEEGFGITLTPSSCVAGDGRPVVTLRPAVRLVLRMANDSLKVSLAKPIRFSMPASRLTLANRTESGVAALVVSADQDVAYAVDLSSEARYAPVGFSRQFRGAVALLRGNSDQQGSGILVDLPTARRVVPWGATFYLGTDSRVVLRLERVGLPWPSMLALCAVALSLFATFAVAPGASFSLLALAIPTLFLLGLRILLGHKVSAFYPSDPLGAGLALPTLWFVPAALLAGAAIGSFLCGDDQKPRTDLLRRSAFGLAAAAPLYALGRALAGADNGGPVILITLASGLVLLLVLGSRPWSWWSRRVTEWRAHANYRRWAIIGLSFVFVARFVGITMGFREAIWIGDQRLAISVFWTPASIVFTALVAARLGQAIDRGLDQGAKPHSLFFKALVAVVVLGIWQLPSVAAGDLGSLVVDLPASLIVLAAMAGVRARGLRWKWAGVLAVPFAVFLLCLLKPQILWPGIEMFFSGSDDPLRVTRPAAYYRVLLGLDPQQIEVIGTRQSEGLRFHYAVAKAYAGRSASGEGYLQTELPRLAPGFLTTLITDDVVPMLVIPDWGLGGHAGLCLVLMMFGFTLVGAAHAPTRFISLLQLTSISYFVYGSLYMIGATTFAGSSSLLPFTGRNVHLLSVLSGSDVLESALVLGLAAVAAGARE